MQSGYGMTRKVADLSDEIMLDINDFRALFGSIPNHGALEFVARQALWLAHTDELVDLVHQAQIGLDLREHLLGSRCRFALGVEPRDQHALTRDLCLRACDRSARTGELGKPIFHR